MRRTYTPSSSFSHSLTAALVHTTSLLPSTPSVLYPSALHPENKPQWELQSSSWLHCWLHSGSTDHIHSNLSCSTARFQTAEGVSCRRVLRVRRFRMQWFAQKMCPFYFVWGLLWCSTVVLATSSMDTKPTAACRDLFSWAYSVNIFI